MSLISMDFAAAQVPAREDSGSSRRPLREDDLAYHSRRAEEELRIAQEAVSPVIRRFHYHLAALHLDRAHAEQGARHEAFEERRVA